MESKSKIASLKRLGGRLCLDFVNTADRNATGTPVVDWLTSYAELVAWSQTTHLITAEQAQHLLQVADRHPDEALAVFVRSIALRETLYQIFAAVAAGRACSDQTLGAFNRALSAALPHLQIVAIESGQFAWGWTLPDALDLMLWHIVRDAAELLVAQERSRIRACAGEDCGWLFLDLSRNRSRRWCDMEDCGNRSKARRHYEKTKRSRRDKG
jgi:predicted RNA-binding Zn ribbon-like protein